MHRFMLRLAIMVLLFCSVNAWCGDGTITGRLWNDKGKPLADAQVFFFDSKSHLERPVLGKFWRVPDYVEQTDETGSFSIAIAEGSYYIAAVKRTTDTITGPPVVGDYFLPSHDRKGNYRRVSVTEGAITDLGIIKGATLFTEKNRRYSGKVTAVEGRLLTQDGLPAEGMYVFAYTDPSMQGRPAFVSERSDRVGSYRLLIDKGRIVYLKVRELYAGGSPRPGALVGAYGGLNSPQPVALRTNFVKRGVDIVVEPFARKVN